MAKKSKQNLQKLIAKKQQLQQLQTTPAVKDRPIPVTQTPTPQVVVETSSQSTTSQEYAAHLKDIKQTALSVLIILICLTTIIVIDLRKPFLPPLSDRLYHFLKLDQS